MEDVLLASPAPQPQSIERRLASGEGEREGERARRQSVQSAVHEATHVTVVHSHRDPGAGQKLLQTELDCLTLSALRARAIGAGVDPATLDSALDAAEAAAGDITVADIKAVAVDLILGRVGSGVQPEPHAPAADTACTTSSRRPRRVDTGALTGLRGLAAFQVALGHMTAGSDLQLDLLGGAAMPFFYLLSGFVMALGYGQTQYAEPPPICGRTPPHPAGGGRSVPAPSPALGDGTASVAEQPPLRQMDTNAPMLPFLQELAIPIYGNWRQVVDAESAPIPGCCRCLTLASRQTESAGPSQRCPFSTGFSRGSCRRCNASLSMRGTIGSSKPTGSKLRRILL
jgi:hypothetical protein